MPFLRCAALLAPYWRLPVPDRPQPSSAAHPTPTAGRAPRSGASVAAAAAGWSLLPQISQAEGIRGFYRGFAPILATVVPANMSYFG